MSTFRSRSMASSPSHICHCCFLNRISILRNTPDQYAELVVASGEELGNADLPRCSLEISIGDRVPSQVSVKSNLSENQLIVSGDSSEFMLPERLVEEKAVKSSDTFVVIGAARGSCTKTKYTTASTNGSIDRSALAQRISSVLEEQKKFLERLNVSFCDEGQIRLHLDRDSDFELGITGDAAKLVNHDQAHNDRVVFYDSGDQFNAVQTKTDKRSQKMLKKPVIFFNEEPIKLLKFGGNESEELISLNDASVKMLFFPENVIKGSSSSVGDGIDSRSVDSGSNSSTYLTAPNSRSDAFSRALFAATEQVRRADSREVFEID